MRSADEIKKGLECCSNVNFVCNEECPYYKSLSEGEDCCLKKNADALVLIQQLQAENAQQARCIENMTDKLNAMNDEVAKLQAERDALMHYLHSMGCDTCLYDDYDGSEPPCINCTATRDLWQFQGVQKEE